MGLAVLPVPALANFRPAMHDDRSDHRIGLDGAAPLPRKFQGHSHPVGVGHEKKSLFREPFGAGKRLIQCTARFHTIPRRGGHDAFAAKLQIRTIAPERSAPRSPRPPALSRSFAAMTPPPRPISARAERRQDARPSAFSGFRLPAVVPFV